jgi:tetratricopeptide (TPR) repeat protein
VINPSERSTRLVTAYRRYLNDGNSPRYAASVNRFYWNNSLLAILARGDIEMRRAAALALGMLGDHAAIEPLGRALSDADRGVRLAADDSFRALLMRDAAPMHHQRLLQVMHLNDGGEHAAALAPTLILADQAPCYAEVHHQLAVCWQGLEDLDAAEAAYCSCLWHCRYHYPAWLGLAKCRVAAGDYAEAIEALQRAVEICPDLETARAQIRALRRRSRQNEG